MEIMGPWRLIRYLLRLLALVGGLWLILALLWAGLPSPSLEHDSDNSADNKTNYATSVLRAGKKLTRV